MSSTDGVSIMRRYGIPRTGFGPGKRAQAHGPNETTWKVDSAKCAAAYAAIPTLCYEQNIVLKTENTNKGEW